MNVLITEPNFYSNQILKECPKNWKITKRQIVSNSFFVKQLKIKQYQIIFVKIGLSVDQSIIDSQPNLKLIVTPTTGLDHIDIKYTKIKNIRVISLKNDYKFLKSITSTAEHAWMLALALQRQLLEVVKQVRNLKWEREKLSIYQLKDKTLGIIGYGRLGKIISNYGKVFQMKVIAYDIKKKINNKTVQFISFNNLLKNSDIIIIVADYKKGQDPIISFEELSILNKMPIIINVSRGGLIDEKAILKALDDNKIKGYGCDVLSDDSNWGNDKVIQNQLINKFKNDNRLLITPHIGGYSLDAIKATREHIFYKSIKYISNLD